MRHGSDLSIEQKRIHRLCEGLGVKLRLPKESSALSFCAHRHLSVLRRETGKLTAMTKSLPIDRHVDHINASNNKGYYIVSSLETTVEN